MVANPFLTQLSDQPALLQEIETANHVDVKTGHGRVSLAEFIAGMFSYMPSWLRFLYGVRKGFVKLLGMEQEQVPQAMAYSAEDVVWQPGEAMTFFRVSAAKPNQYWFANADERHLRATLGVVATPSAEGETRFSVITIVHYNDWSGPLYFNVIRPFHHLVVAKMMRAGLGR